LFNFFQGEFEQKREEDLEKESEGGKTDRSDKSDRSDQSRKAREAREGEEGEDKGEEDNEKEDEEEGEGWEEMDQKQGYELAVFTGFRDEIGIATGIVEGKIYRRTINARKPSFFSLAPLFPPLSCHFPTFPFPFSFPHPFLFPPLSPSPSLTPSPAWEYTAICVSTPCSTPEEAISTKTFVPFLPVYWHLKPNHLRVGGTKSKKFKK
jgi:hypothetical protein